MFGHAQYRNGRRIAGIVGGGLGSVGMTAALLFSNPYASLICLSLAYGGVGFIQPNAFAVSIDIAPRHAGAVAGAMNTACQAGGFVSSLVFGYLVKLSGSYTLPLIPIVLMFLLCAGTWLRSMPRKNSSQKLEATTHIKLHTIAKSISSLRAS